MMTDDERTGTGAIGRRDALKMIVGGAVSALAATVVGGDLARAAPAAGSAPKPRLPIIDAHCHPNWIGYDGAKMIENMDAAGIGRAWLLSWELTEREMSPTYHSKLNPTGVGIPFSDVIEVATRYPDRFIPGTTFDPHDQYALDKLKAAVEIHGVRVFGEFKRRLRYDDPDAIRLFHYCGELGLPVILHLDVTMPRHGVPSSWQWWYGGGIENLEEPLKLCPKTQFLGHAPGFWREISADADREPTNYAAGKPIVGRGMLLELLNRYPNLNCDLSAGSALTALSRDRAFARKFLIDYQDRCVFGRDEFTNRLHDFLVSLDLPGSALAKILSGNALRLVPV